MPLCHNCPEQAEVAAAIASARPFEDSPCAGCHWTGLVPHNNGQTFVSLDANEGAQGHLEHDGVSSEPDFIQPAKVPDSPEAFAGIPVEACEALRKFFAEWLCLNSTMRDAVATRLADPEVPSTEIAKRLKASSASVSIALIRASSRCQALEAVRLRRNKLKRKTVRPDPTPAG